MTTPYVPTPAVPGQPTPPAIPTNKFSFPQVSKPLDASTHGIASLSHKGRTFRFRTNPNSFNWTYTLNKHIDQTYGGRVIQLLSTNIDNFVVEADCGGGRWEYAAGIANFLRNIMIDQRDGTPATFEYTTRGWKLNVFVVSMPFEDSVTEVLRTFSIQMKVQEDVSGVMTKNSIRAELRRLQDGLDFTRNKYNDPNINSNDEVDSAKRTFTDAMAVADTADQVMGYGSNNYLDTNWNNIRDGVPTSTPSAAPGR